MEIIALRCPSCSANLEFDSGKNIGYCQYCGTKILIRDNMFRGSAPKYSSEIDKLRAMIEIYYDNGYDDKVRETAMRMIDEDPTCAEGWYFKGLYAVSMAERRMCFETAMKYVESEEIRDKLEVALVKMDAQVEVRLGEMSKYYQDSFKITVDDVTIEKDRFVALDKGMHTFKLVPIISNVPCCTKNEKIEADTTVSARTKPGVFLVVPALEFKNI